MLRVQSLPTRDTSEKARMLLDYAATYPNAILRYKANDMVLYVDSDASYLTMPEERICYAGHFYLSDWLSPSPIKTNPERNGPIHTKCKRIRNVVSSAAESETCGAFNKEKIYRHATRLNQIGPQKTSNNSQNGQFNYRRICKLRYETKTFKNMGYEIALVEL